MDVIWLVLSGSTTLRRIAAGVRDGQELVIGGIDGSETLNVTLLATAGAPLKQLVFPQSGGGANATYATAQNSQFSFFYDATAEVWRSRDHAVLTT